MDQDQGPPISPTLAKVLKKFLEVMKADEAIEDDAADRLDALLRSGKALKPDEISAALFPPPEDEENGAIGDGA
ncbi:hypothetical protein FBT96_19570 [Rhodobacter capsulatus]|uniref:Uncharacterized protein n=1 Tax=Rhodobacter capsulatus TaxID=1061 RepID=A0A4V6WQV4_RHOCA|nr:hypothetical protein [Rhodobacter capsulatus]TKD13458.1 hypothetical protein FBT96_19570 [Rhodobacter capsulatus]